MLLSHHSTIKSTTKTTRLYYNGNDDNNSFDLSKPTFDLFSFRFIRQDGLLRYNNLNQSEPLRINLFLLATITLLGYPLWCESVTGDVATPTQIIAACASGVGCAAGFWRERTRRDLQLKRIEKELNAESLEVRIPVNAAISTARPTARLKDLKSKRRIVAIRGSKEQLSGQVWNLLSMLRRRLAQSQTLVVIVPTDASEKEDWGWDANQMSNSLWLADPLDVDMWIEYFDELLDSSDDKKSSDELCWFALNFKGRSIASGVGQPPRLLELLGQQLQPMDLLDETDEAELPDPLSKEIFQCQQEFYNALTGSSDPNDMRPIFSATNPAEEVDEVLNGGGRLDGWGTCLEPDARPSGMTISGSDVWIASNTLAYSSCIEFPRNAGIDGGTLLATQRWRRESEGSDWKLELHQVRRTTILLCFMHVAPTFRYTLTSQCGSRLYRGHLEQRRAVH